MFERWFCISTTSTLLSIRHIVDAFNSRHKVNDNFQEQERFWRTGVVIIGYKNRAYTQPILFLS